MSLATSTQWKCFLCCKWNDDVDLEHERKSTHCKCCHRERTFVPKSMTSSQHAKPLALHGIASIQHPYRKEQLMALKGSGLDLTAAATNGWTPLHCAARLGQDQVLANLLSLPDVRACNLEATSVGGWRALHHAIYAGHIRCVEELLLVGADVNARLNAADDGLTPLHLAAKHGHTTILELLIQCGGDVHLLTQALGRSALHIAVEHGHLSCVRLLAIQTDLIEYVDNDGISPLQQAHMLSAKNTMKHEIITLLESIFRQRTLGREPRLLPSDMMVLT